MLTPDSISEKNYTLPRLFEAQVERTPEATALVFENHRLTYRELNAKANQLAYHLRALGVEPEKLVGICGERSIEMLIGFLGILKAGGAYVPLDPSYPQERLAFMLSDSQVSVLLTQEKLVARLPEHQALVVCLDTDWKKIVAGDASNLDSGVQPDNLAYTIYTSGSTGKPKGVMMNHQGVCNGLLWLQKTYQLTERDRILQKTPFSFDISTWELFWPLMIGACVVLAKPGGHQDTMYLVKLIAQEQITIVHMVPSMLQIFLDELDLETSSPEDCSSLRQIFSAGEALPFALKEHFFERVRDCQLHDIYGSAETFAVTYWDCQSEREPQSFSIGCPIANLPIYILDEQMQPVPVGETGELYVGESFLARGYLNQPKLTAERFIPNPFEKSKLNRLYKTGDLARYLPDGNIEHLGRIDHQVKIRDFRIELGEIERELSKHPVVKQAVVIAREDIASDKRLVAYYVLYPSEDSKGVIVPELRKFLQERLPEYMIPSAFVVLDDLPLNPNGKVDRQSLPAPNLTRPILEQEFVASRTPVETKLADILSQTLNIHPVGVRDNFFEIGGNSLLAIRLLAQVRHAFGVDLPIDCLLEKPTVADMAQALETFRNSEEVAGIQGMTVEKLLSEACLDSTIQVSTSSVNPITEPNAIFLTGGTGFLGAFLLYELLRQTQANIYCLVRDCKTFVEGKQKIQTNLKRYLLEHECFNSRIIPVIGNLSQPHLGLDEQHFEQLAEKIDVIYHTATFLNSAYPYTALRAVNVQGTQEILKLASKIKPKPVHFVSSPAVFESAGYLNKPSIKEEDNLDDCEVVYGGYGQSKWVGEKLLKTAHLRGIPVYIYRPGMISGHSQTGASDTNQILARLIKGFIQQGIAPNIDVIIDMTPVDYVSQAIVHLSKQKESQGKSFNLVNSLPLHLRELVKVICSLGYPIEQTEYVQWESKMSDVISNSPENALSDILPILTAKIPRTQLTSLESSFNIISRLDCENTIKGLAETSITCPPVDSKLLRTYLSYFEQGSPTRISSPL